jgi:hypothetical protein
LHGFDKEFSYAVVQLHVFRFNVTVTVGKKDLENSTHFGTTFSFVLNPRDEATSLFLRNDNIDDVQFMVSVVVYDKNSPLLGGCSLNSSRIELNYEETEEFIILHTPAASESNNNCNGSSLKYSTYFGYLRQFNFTAEAYFEGVKSLLFKNVFKNGFKVKCQC